MPTALGVIPARFASSRFPGKPLVSLHDGRTLLETVWNQAIQSKNIEQWVIATDDDRIEAECDRIGATCVRTSPDHPSGTDRIAEVARQFDPEPQWIVNLQGDEPLVTPSALDRLVEALRADPSLEMATLAEPFEGDDAQRAFNSPHVVKVVRDLAGNALYFSRHPIPHGGSYEDALRHQGIYAYTKACLLRFTDLPASNLEKLERLEQLRALDHGIQIRVMDSDFKSQGIDTPADVERVKAIQKEMLHAQ